MLPYPAGDHRRSPPPRAVFSSSLSPTAAPFPAADPGGPDRDLPTAPSVYAAAPGDWGNASWMEPPVSYMAPVAAPSAVAPGREGDAPRSSPYGIYSRIHYSDFPSLQPIRSESPSLLSEKHPGSFQEKSELPSNCAGPSVFNQQQSYVLSKLLDHSGAEGTGPYPPRQDLNQYPFGSSCDNYMTQLSPCPTDAQPHISVPYVDSAEMVKRTAPVMNVGESSFSSSYMNPYRINLDYFDCAWNEQKDIGYQTPDKQYGKWSNSLDSMAAAGNHPLNPLCGEHLGNGRHMMESSKTKCDSGNFCSKFSSSEIGFLQPHEFSSELLEVNNTSVDSPCWKGTPAAYPSSFGIMENKDAHHMAVQRVSYNSSYQRQKTPELNLGYHAELSECQKVSGSENDLSKVFKLPVTCEDFNDLGVPPIRVYNDVTGQASCSPNKQHSRMVECYDPGEDSKNVVTLSQQECSCPAIMTNLLVEHSSGHEGSMTEEINKKLSSPTIPRLHVDNLPSDNPHGNSTSASVGKEESTQKRGESSQCYPGAKGNMLNMSSDSSSSTRAIFLKLMHNLSVALLSTCKVGYVFPDDEEEILESVIQNLTAASSNRSKVEQNTNYGLSNSSQMKFKNINCVSNSLWTAMHEHSTSKHDLEFRTSISEVLTARPEDKIFDDTENSEASIYKKLWIEAEASACKLKYELQLACVKLAAMNGHSHTLKASHLSEGNKGSNLSTASNKQQSLVKESTAPLQHQEGDSGNRQSSIVNRSTVNGIDDDVFARWKVWQSHTDNVTSFEKFDCEGQQEASKKPCEDAVMARLKVLKSRPDVTFLSQESMPDARINTTDDAVMARLRILESHPNNATFLGQESSKQHVNAGTEKEDIVDDDDVMARLRILKSRPDNVSTPCDISKEHEEACVDQLNRDGVEVMSSRRFGNMEPIEEFVRSFHLANRLKRNDSTGGPDSADETCAREKASGSADVASPKMGDSPSEETSNKDALGEDNLDGNHVWPQAAGVSNVSSEGSQEIHLVPVNQYGSSPSEWEHVLKENFFHPSK